ncbi:MAG: hypothetical protein IPL61_29710 [Myxococcales bacterium]|nr:hypothetical protein [Myxococcales bacterium]
MRSILRRAPLALVTLMALATAARGDEVVHKYAHFAQVDEATVTEARGFKVAGVAGTTHVVVGRNTTGYAWQARRAILMSCTARACEGAVVGLRGADTLAVVGVVDLAGDATELPITDGGGRAQPGAYLPLPRVGAGPRRMKWPALVLVAATEQVVTEDSPDGRSSGTDRQHALVLISLRKTDRGQEVFRGATIARGPSGGTTASYRLVRERPRGPRTIVATVQRYYSDRSACVPPPPIEVRYVWKERRFEEVPALAGARGCH